MNIPNLRGIGSINNKIVKSLSRTNKLKRGFQYVNSNSVIDVNIFEDENKTVVRSKVKSSYRDEYHDVDLKFKDNLISGHCSCIAGSSGDCNHCVDAAIQIGLNQEESDLTRPAKKRKSRYEDIMQVAKIDLPPPCDVTITTPPIKNKEELLKLKKNDLSEELKKRKTFNMEYSIKPTGKNKGDLLDCLNKIIDFENSE